MTAMDPFKLLNNRMSSQHTTPFVLFEFEEFLFFIFFGGVAAVLKLDNDDMAQVYLWV